MFRKKPGIMRDMDAGAKPNMPTMAPGRFIREVIAELKKVTWPTREETMKLTAVVIVISVIVGVFIGGLDSLFVKITTCQCQMVRGPHVFRPRKQGRH